MKPRKNNAPRLSLSKQTIAKLDEARLAQLRGGNDSKIILSILLMCGTGSEYTATATRDCQQPV
ncbi:hypothetical protein F0L74_28925 [Chitinophaga agrisoli]|uniref:Uncharacterized protein n=1 Tax=Chitinophaga agrisoli TaxID=2607653 RepID=A0A5B2VPJ0_9BACT|nr:class I lanthipeptide [Chitinophaga agrisoli]KAA2240192.1 hypothetical protein F0L74_28925 [Chitinophaga agrisoli]